MAGGLFFDQNAPKQGCAHKRDFCMTQQFRDDCPAEFDIGRRIFVAGSVMFMGARALTAHVASAQADEPSSLAASKFMKISTLLIDHKLNAQVGARMAVAMGKVYPGIEHDIDQILAVAIEKNAKVVEDFFPGLPEGRLKETCLAIISAWYTGVIVDAPGSEVFAFELALMYQPTSDVMTIPSYAISGPNGWNSSAPNLSDMPAF